MHWLTEISDPVVREALLVRAREKRRDYYQRNKEKVIAYAKRYRQENAGLVRLAASEYRRRNREKIRAYDREYYQRQKCSK